MSDQMAREASKETVNDEPLTDWESEDFEPANVGKLPKDVSFQHGLVKPDDQHRVPNDDWTNPQGVDAKGNSVSCGGVSPSGVSFPRDAFQVQTKRVIGSANKVARCCFCTKPFTAQDGVRVCTTCK